MVLDGTLTAGEQIRQQEMAEALSVSRVPLREALNVLASEGLLQHRLNSGYFVVKRTSDEVRQIWRMLAMLEDELLLSMEWQGKHVARELRRLNAAMRLAVRDQDWPTLLTLNREFHFVLFNLSPDKLVLAEVQRLWTLASSLIAQKIAHPDAAARTLVEHDAIIDAVEREDRELCLKRMAEHRLSTHPHGPQLVPRARK
jgi:DNA-binding GntR family transcriptional regulator